MLYKRNAYRLKFSFIILMRGDFMELKQLQYFSEIIKYGSINKASQALFISQPYLSHVVKDLEKELNVRLVIRSKNGIVITAEGERLLSYAHKILKDMDNLMESFSPCEKDEEKLSVSMTKFSHVMEAFIDVCSLHDDCTKFTYRLNEGSPLEVINDIKNNISQVGVIHYDSSAKGQYMKLIEQNNLEYFPLASLSPCIVISRNHPVYLKNPEIIDVEDLKYYGFVRYIGEFEDFIYNLQIDGKQVDLDKGDKKVYIYGRATLMHMVAATNFYTVGIKDFDIQRQVYNVVSVPIKGCENKLNFGYVVREESVLSNTAAGFIEKLKKVFSK